MEYDFSRQIGKIICIAEKTKKTYVKVEDITHICCDEYVSSVYLLNGQKYSTSHGLTSFEEELGEYGFVEANNHTLINRKHLSISWISQGKKYIKVNDIEIVVSRRHRASF